MKQGSNDSSNQGSNEARRQGSTRNKGIKESMTEEYGNCGIVESWKSRIKTRRNHGSKKAKD